MNKRTSVDFSKHELIHISEPHVKIWKLKIKDSVQKMVTFINSENIMAVTGDYGNWIFCKEFHPSKDGYVSDYYWCEKLQILSEQEYKEFDYEYTIELLEEEIKELKEEPYENEEQQKEALEYYEECLFWAKNDDEIDYINYARNFPNFMDSDFFIIGKKIKNWLLIIFDAFEEICKRYNEEYKKKESKRLKKPEKCDNCNNNNMNFVEFELNCPNGYYYCDKCCYAIDAVTKEIKNKGFKI